MGWTDLCAKSDKYPAGTSRLNDVVLMSQHHTDVASKYRRGIDVSKTSLRRHVPAG